METKASLAANYERYLGPLLFEPYAVDLTQRVAGSSNETILELACGTGRVTHHLLNHLNSSGTLYATDLDSDMLSIVQRKLPDSRIRWQIVDAQTLPYPDHFFDLVVCQFGVMFFRDKGQAFREAYRVLKEKSTFLFSTWDEAKYNALAYHTQLALNLLLQGKAPQFSHNGPYSFFDKEKITQLLQAAGFKKMAITEVALIGIAKDLEAALTGNIEGSPLGAYLKKMKISKEDLKALLRQSLSTYLTNDLYHLPMQALVCQATK